MLLSVILSAELVPEDLEDFSMGLGNSFSWGSSFFTSISFSFINQILGLYTFLPFMFCNILTILFVFFFVPETKGKSMEELTKEFSYEEEDSHVELKDDEHHVELKDDENHLPNNEIEKSQTILEENK